MAADTFAEKLRIMIKASGMTQAEVARKAGLTEGAISHYVKGVREPGYASIGNLAEALGVPVERFYNSATDNDSVDEALRVITYNAESLTPEQVSVLADVLAEVSHED